jgi:hypothetical protein
VDIFICAHKDFNACPKNKIYKVIHGNEDISVPLEEYTESHTEFSDFEFSLAEGSRIYWLYKNYNPKKYIGICHYRKYFSFFDDVPNIEEIFEAHDIIVTEPQTQYGIIRQYSLTHNVRDIIDVINIVNETQKSWIERGFMKSVNGNVLYACNMFIMRSDDFLKYCECVFGVIKEFCKRRGWENDNDVKKYVELNKEDYLKMIYPGNTIEYQSRVLGFLLERLTSLYISTHFSKPYKFPILVTEDKYKGKSGNNYIK